VGSFHFLQQAGDFGGLVRQQPAPDFSASERVSGIHAGALHHAHHLLPRFDKQVEVQLLSFSGVGFGEETAVILIRWYPIAFHDFSSGGRNLTGLARCWSFSQFCSARRWFVYCSNLTGLARRWSCSQVCSTRRWFVYRSNLTGL